MAGENITATKVNFSQNDKELLRNIFRKINDFVYIINAKDTGIYNDEEVFTSQQWYVNRPINQQKMIFRKIVDVGTLPNVATTSTSHELNRDATGAVIPITADWDIIRIRLKAFDPAGIIWIDASDPRITISVDATDIDVTTIDDFSAFTQCGVILEYTKA